MKVRITYISHRGASGHENLYPEQHWLTSDAKGTFEQACLDLIRTGFTDTRCKCWVSPAAIIEIRQEPD